MSKKKKSEIVPNQLRDELIEIALLTDCIAKYKIDGWRESAVCAARWLIRTAALADEQPRTFSQAFKTIAELCDKTRGNGTTETETDKLVALLEKYKYVKMRDIS